jgi:DNA polymerase III delta subunit
MLARAFSELVTVGGLADEGKDASDMEQLLRWNAWKIKICIGSAKRWGTQKLTRALARLRELDAASKSGGVSGYKVIEMFICEYI